MHKQVIVITRVNRNKIFTLPYSASKNDMRKQNRPSSFLSQQEFHLSPRKLFSPRSCRQDRQARTPSINQPEEKTKILIRKKNFG